MKNFIRWLGIISLVTVIGLTFVSCAFLSDILSGGSSTGSGDSGSSGGSNSGDSGSSGGSTSSGSTSSGGSSSGGSTSGGGSSTSGGGGGGNSSNSGAVSPALNGTWAGKIDKNQYQMIFNNGDYSCTINDHVSEKGTYTTSTRRSMTMTGTHVHGDWITANGIAIEKKWYTKTELEAALKGKMSDANISRTVKNFYSQQRFEYSVNGDRLTLRGDGDWSGDGGALTFTKTK
jgi:hypothetical protein